MRKENDKSPSTKLHGKVIKYNQIKQLPSRNLYLCKEEYSKINKDITRNKDLLFMPNSIHEMNLQDKKYEKAKYKIILWGILEDGRRATVVLNEIYPYFEAKIPDNISNDEINEYAQELFEEIKERDEMSPFKYEITEGKPFKLYQKEKKSYIRFYFNKLKMRKNAIKYLRLEKNLETAHDDLTCYYRVFCRDRFMSFTSWNVISNYKIGTNKNIKGPIYNVHVPSGGYKTFEGDISKFPKLIKDKSMTMTWDIETFSPDGSLPIPENENHRLFMIGITFHWYNSSESLLRVCLVDKECAPHKDYLTIVCGKEDRLIKGFGKIFEKMAPEFVVGFNDSDYDWPWLIKRAVKTKGLLRNLSSYMNYIIPWNEPSDSDIFKYNFSSSRVKVEADMYAEGNSLQFPGYINLDVRTIFRQLYPTAEKSSLNWYLQKNKMSGKKDMPYQEMFKIYRRMARITENTEDDREDDTDEEDENEFAIETRKCKTIDDFAKRMREVAEYCVIDAQRCHELLKIRYVIMERREISNVAYTSLYEAFYRANGSKVRNLVIARGQKRGLKISNIKDESLYIPEGKYPGAYVFSPKKGLVTSKLTMDERREKAISFQKSKKPIPSELAEWLEISDEQIKKYKKFIKENGAIIDFSKNSSELKEIESIFKKIPSCVKNFFEESTGRPITGLDFSSLYPSLIMCYNLSPEYMILSKKYAKELYSKGIKLNRISFPMGGVKYTAWSVSHENKLDPTKDDYRFGIYPQILKELFDNRKLMKKDLHKWEKEKEIMEALPEEEFNLPENKVKYDNIEFQYNCINSKQKALKVFMNTFYGETGNKNSPFFLLQLAGGITTLGQKNIKAAHKFVTERNCGVWYGDTDSIYLTMSEDKFTKIDKLYFSGEINKLDYWSELVNITFKEIKFIQDGVNNWFLEDNGTNFLKMAYEEALFPVAFLAKKKYYGIPHISVPNFNFKHLFIRGLEVKKRGVSQFLRDICNGIMETSVSIENTFSLLELVQNKIHDIYSSNFRFSDFIMTDVYKPNKQNVKVQTFVKRMTDKGIKVKPWERFNYVIVEKNPYFYDYRGRKRELKVGDKMEYANIAEETGLKIDLDYYMKGSINGQLARLITYHEMFYVEPIDSSQDAIDVSEKKIYDKSGKYIENFCKTYYKNYTNKGKIYKKVFSVANKIVKTKLNEVYKNPGIIDIITSSCDLKKLEEWLCIKAEKKALKGMKTYGKDFVDKRLNKLISEKDLLEKKEINIFKKKKIRELQEVYFSNKKNILNIREIQFRQRFDILKRNIRENLTEIKGLYSVNQNMIESLTIKIKECINIDNRFNDSGIDIPKWEEIKEVEKIDENELNNIMEKNMKYLSNDKKFWDSMNKLKYIYTNLVTNYKFINEVRCIVSYLKLLRDKELNIHSDKDFDKEKLIKESINDIMSQEILIGL